MQLLEQHFDAAFAAPDGIKKLRELILTLAMQGKLVEQDPSDQPASELLKEIEQEKRRLVTAGKTKAPKPLPAIEADEVPYEVPTGWEWVRLGRIAEYIQRGKGPSYSEERIIPVVSQKCVQWRGFDKTAVRYIDPKSIKNYGSERILRYGDLLWNSTGTGTIGRINLYKDELSEFEYAVADSHVTIVRLLNISREYALWFLMSPYVQEAIERSASGTTNQIELNTSTVESQLFAVPPLAEQRRIVARIDELMARCDELENLRAEREQKRLDAHTAALNALLGAQEPAAFAEAWQFMTQHFSDLHSVPKNVTELRKAMLQLAVMGKLVEQDPNDPPASELLKEIQEEKNRLIVAGKIRAPKPLPPVTPEEMPYPVPTGWEWVRLQNLFSDLKYGTAKKCDYNSGSCPVLRIPNVVGGKTDIADLKYTDLDSKEIKDLSLKDGDVLIIRSNGSERLVGRCAVVGQNAIGFAYAGYLMRIRIFKDQILPQYVHKAMESKEVRYAIESPIRSTSGVKNINSTEVSQLKIALPPLPEQRRIVAKIDQLMDLCDQLEATLASQTDQQSALLESVMAAVTPASAAPTRRAAPAGEPVRRGPDRPRREVTEASSEDQEVPVLRRKPGRPRKEHTEAISAEATPMTARRGPGRPRKNPTEPTRSIPEATSATDAIRRLEALKIERATGTRQVGLFESETDGS